MMGVPHFASTLLQLTVRVRLAVSGSEPRIAAPQQRSVEASPQELRNFSRGSSGCAGAPRRHRSRERAERFPTSRVSKLSNGIRANSSRL
jgi:hypothetical protein